MLTVLHLFAVLVLSYDAERALTGQDLRGGWLCAGTLALSAFAPIGVAATLIATIGAVCLAYRAAPRAYAALVGPERPLALPAAKTTEAEIDRLNRELDRRIEELERQP